MTEAETFGINMVIWVHDRFDNDVRAEITQQADIATLEKAAGWNAHELNQTTDQFFYYGEGIAATSLITGAGPANLFGWDDFQGDECFNGKMTIYRITFEYGWEASGTFDDAWVADIKLNGQLIPLKPDSSGSGRIAHRYFTEATNPLAFTIAPKTPYRLLSLAVHVDAVPDTTEVFTLTVDATRSALCDTLILSEDLFIGSRTSLFVPFGIGYEFTSDDEIDIAQANGSPDDWGVTVMYQTVFA